MITTFKKFPFVTELPDTNQDPVGFFEAMKLADLEGKFVRIATKLQKRFFGCAPFGKLGVRISEMGDVTTLRSVAFGKDFEEITARYDCFEKNWFQVGNEQRYKKHPSQPF